MTSFREQNYYQLLDVSPDADSEVIAKAYAVAKRTFSGDSLATYSLFDAADREALLARVEEAYRVLSDQRLRASYDEDVLGIRRRDSVKDQSVEEKPAPRPSLARPAFTLEDVTSDAITGPLLRARREAIGMPLQEIARNTRISIAYLQFIEEDHERGLPHETYLRGYLVQYAKAVGLSPDIVADGYLRHLKALRSPKP